MDPRNTGLEEVTDDSSKTRRLFKKAIRQGRSDRTAELWMMNADAVVTFVSLFIVHRSLFSVSWMVDFLSSLLRSGPR